jgi:uracil-DNA glycosylase family 4
MPSGFFHSSRLIDIRKPDLSTVHLLSPKCGACGLAKTCRSPKMPVAGKGKKGILIIGEAPGSAEDKMGKPFVGKAGQYLQEKLEDLGIDLFNDCWVTNANICRPPNNENPELEQVDHCRPNVLQAIATYRPTVIILLGGNAIDSVIGWLWKDKALDDSGVKRWAGWQIPCQTTNAWVCPTFHPSFILRRMEENDRISEHFFESHLANAVSLADSRPWKRVPKWSENVEIIEDHHTAARRIMEIIRWNKPTASDYETNSLKMEYDGAKILCCSLSVLGSRKAIAFHWHGRAIKAMKKFWKRVPTIMSNMKFEGRVTKAMLDIDIGHYYWDTMLAAHVLDCRSGITSIKFQVFVQLGVGDYSDHIEPFLRAARGRRINMAETEIDPKQLLQYCGEDSLYEGIVAEVQIPEMEALAGIKPNFK